MAVHMGKSDAMRDTEACNTFLSLKDATLLAFQVCSPAITCEASALPDYGLL